MKAILRGRQIAEAAGVNVSVVSKSAESNASSLREQIDEILRGSRKKSLDRTSAKRRAAPSVRAEFSRLQPARERACARVCFLLG